MEPTTDTNHEGETGLKRELAHYEEAMRKKDERRFRLQLERDALLVVVSVLSEELTMLRRSYEKDSNP